MRVFWLRLKRKAFCNCNNHAHIFALERANKTKYTRAESEEVKKQKQNILSNLVQNSYKILLLMNT